ncbi:site-specific integrase [Clostridium sp. BNL1100]|uniref:site-specific integrase n=1 Tax=Clostridium sp. BNL1100 TaxID=755731 RepID=UPI00024A7C98|nr:site-specific integrase [Clostridium sp. BNL1100]AEY65751.1 phage integrase family protein [Clostridium sp. BNL1100]
MCEDKYIHAVEFLAKKYKTVLNEEDSYIFEKIATQNVEEEIEQVGVTLINLSSLPYDNIGKLKVSRISFFQDSKWDWRQEGSPIYRKAFFSWDKNVSNGVSLLNKENFHLCHLLKMIAFYYLPQNACFNNVKSYNTTKAQLSCLINLGKFLFKNRFFVDIQGNGTFINTAYLRKEHFLDYLENDLKDPNSKYNFSKQVKQWRIISQNGLIPVEYRLDFDPFEADMYKKLFYDMEENKGTYMPISLETLSELIPLCIKLIETHSDEVLKLYNVLWPIIAGGKVRKTQKFKWSNAIDELLRMNLKSLDLKMFRFVKYEDITMSMKDSNKLIHAIYNHPNWNKETLKFKDVKNLSRHERLKIASKLGIDLELFDKSTMYDLLKIKREATNLVIELRNACVVILFLVTGMRCSEMYLLEYGGCWQIKGSEDDFRIRISVSKTSDASSGNIVVLPIPEIGYKAFKCLEYLTEKARIWGKTDKLMVSPTVFFGKEIQQETINLFIQRWCEDLEIEHIHPHRFRKTLAMFAIYQNPNYIGIIKRLFSHKSLAMTLAYIVKLPGMNEEIKLSVIEQNKQLLSELLEAINRKCIGGKAGNRIKEVLSESKIFKANLYDYGWESLEQYIEILLQDGLKILHRTSFGAICTNTHSGLAYLGPETCNCNVVDCEWAVFTGNSIEDLENDIKFHSNLLTKDCSEEQKQFSMSFIKNCIERLSELKGSEIVSKKYHELINMRA